MNFITDHPSSTVTPHRQGSNNDSFELLPFLRSPGFALLFAICAPIGGCFAWSLVAGDRYVIVSFDCGKGREILITGDREWELTQPICFAVEIDGEIVVPHVCISGSGGYNDARDFGIRFAANREVVGVFDQSCPAHYQAVHDFRDGASWPRGEGMPEFRGSGTLTRQDLEALLDAEFKAIGEAGQATLPRL